MQASNRLERTYTVVKSRVLGDTDKRVIRRVNEFLDMGWKVLPDPPWERRNAAYAVYYPGRIDVTHLCITIGSLASGYQVRDPAFPDEEKYLDPGRLIRELGEPTNEELMFDITDDKYNTFYVEDLTVAIGPEFEFSQDHVTRAKGYHPHRMSRDTGRFSNVCVGDIGIKSVADMTVYPVLANSFSVIYFESMYHNGNHDEVFQIRQNVLTKLLEGDKDKTPLERLRENYRNSIQSFSNTW